MAALIDIPTFSDSRGSLSVLETAVPFDIKRVYYIFGANSLRGGHRHRNTKQILVSVCGSCSVYINNGVIEQSYELTQPDKGLIVECDDWHTMDNFSADCVLLVLASEPYDVNDYIDEPY